MKPPAELIGLLRRHDPDVQTVAIAMRNLVLGETGPCHETLFQFSRNNVVSILYSSTEKRMKDNICLIVVYRDHVNQLFPTSASSSFTGTTSTCCSRAAST